MKLTLRRIAILFSVALNIGFVVMAVAMLLHRSDGGHQRSWSELLDIVERLELPAAEQHAAVDTIRRFKTTIEAHDRNLHLARDAVLSTLARAGSLDSEALERCSEAVGREERIKLQAFKTHVIDLRRQLGDEKGARFFALLLQSIQAKHGAPDR